MIDIQRLQMLTLDANERQKLKDQEQAKKDKATAQKIFEKDVPKLCEKAANLGKFNTCIYDLRLGSDYHFRGSYQVQDLIGVGRELYLLCEAAGLNPYIGSYYDYTRTRIELRVHWVKK